MGDHRWLKPEVERTAAPNVPEDGDDYYGSYRSSLDYHAPLRSVKSEAGPSPFYKLSSELSRESLRIPGAVPFLWEQSPGQRKCPSPVSPLNNSSRPPPPPPPQTDTYISPAVSDPNKPTLATLFRQSSVRSVSATHHIAPPPAADRSRSSSARYPILQHIPADTQALVIDDIADTDSDATSDALTATAGGFSNDDSLVMSGPVKPSSTSSDARDFIMHRFLPAAQAIACDSPQAPSRRITLPTSQTVCADHLDNASNSVSFGPSPLRYVSAPGTPGSGWGVPPMFGSQRHGGSFRTVADQWEEEEEEDDEAGSRPRACGFFAFHILNFNQASRHRKHRDKSKSSKARSNLGTPRRIIDYLCEDDNDGRPGGSCAQRLQIKQRPPHGHNELINTVAGMHTDRWISKASPIHSYTDFHEEVLDHISYYDALSRFQSPSPAWSHLNPRARLTSRPMSASLYSPRHIMGKYVVEAIQPSGRFNGGQAPPVISTSEQHLLNSSVHYYNLMHGSNVKPHDWSCIASPSSCHSHFSPTSLKFSPHHGNNADQWGALSPNNDHMHKETSGVNNVLHKETSVINNVLYSHEGQGPLETINRARVTHACEHEATLAQEKCTSNCNDAHNVDRTESPVVNVDPYAKVPDNTDISNGDQPLNELKISPSPFGENMNCLLSPPLPKSPTHSWLGRAIPLVSAGGKASVICGTPPRSRLAHMQKALPPCVYPDEPPFPAINKIAPLTPTSAVDSKWEAIVKGSHLHRGHLRFSEVKIGGLEASSLLLDQVPLGALRR